MSTLGSDMATPLTNLCFTPNRPGIGNAGLGVLTRGLSDWLPGAIIPERRAYRRNVAQRQFELETCQLRRRSAMTVQAMGYFWVGTSKLDDWNSLAIGQLGLQALDRGSNMRAFRMDDRKQRLIVDGGLTDGERFFGWEVADATALDALAARLEKASR